MDKNSIWLNPKFDIKLQQGEGLGEKMQNAFVSGFQDDYEKIVLIGTDCYNLNANILEDAFFCLDKNEVVFGPANDGGYYLVGMTKSNPGLFLNKTWSHENVLEEATDFLNENDLNYGLVQELIDVDTYDDLTQTNLNCDFDI